MQAPDALAGLAVPGDFNDKGVDGLDADLTHAVQLFPGLARQLLGEGLGNDVAGQLDLFAQSVVVALDGVLALVPAVVHAQAHVIPLAPIQLVGLCLVHHQVALRQPAHDVLHLPASLPAGELLLGAEGFFHVPITS